MEINRSAIKGNARLQMRDAKPSALLVALIFIVIRYIMTYLSGRIMGYTAYYQALLEAYASSALHGDWSIFSNVYYYGLPSPGILARLLNIAMDIVMSVLGVGFMIYCLNVSRRLPAAIGNLFDGFGLFFKIIGLVIVQWFFVFLWSLLFLIPGIVASYRYRQAYYLLIDNPDWSVMDCIRESKRLMTGRKGELFVLDLSFIGWYILAAVPFVSVWVAPYTEMTYANYYNALVALEGTGYNGRDIPPGGGYAEPTHGGFTPPEPEQYREPEQGGGYGDKPSGRDSGHDREPWERDRD